MNLFELLELSVTGKEHSKKLKDNISFDISYEFINRVNSVLTILDSSQNELMKKKFKTFSDIHQLYDKLSEILVAYRFLNQNPVFINEEEGGPDIYLSNDDKYIEVKTLNNSDFQNEAVEVMQNSGGMFISTSTLDPNEELRKENAVYKKAYELICKACKQLENKKGVIFLVYSIDILRNSRVGKADFESKIQTHITSFNLRNVSFELLDKKDLFGRVSYF